MSATLHLGIMIARNLAARRPLRSRSPSRALTVVRFLLSGPYLVRCQSNSGAFQFTLMENCSFGCAQLDNVHGVARPSRVWSERTARYKPRLLSRVCNLFMCNLESPHVQERHAMGKELPPIAEDIDSSHHSHMPTPQVQQDADKGVSWLRSVYRDGLEKSCVGSLCICSL